MKKNINIYDIKLVSLYILENIFFNVLICGNATATIFYKIIKFKIV